MGSIKLCLVEDQDIVRKSLGIVLSMEEDLEVVGYAENGRIAIEICEKHQPDVVLMDINMPVMDGVEAAYEIKQKWPEIKIVILTTFHDVEYVQKALNAGAEGYILKDIDPKNLASVVRLVNAGETMIPQNIAKQLFKKLSNVNNEINSSKELNWSEAYGITPRELEVLNYLAEGLKNRDIAQKLFLSEGSVRNYISNIYSKLNVENRACAIKKFMETSS